MLTYMHISRYLNYKTGRGLRKKKKKKTLLARLMDRIVGVSWPKVKEGRKLFPWVLQLVAVLATDIDDKSMGAVSVCGASK